MPDLHEMTKQTASRRPTANWAEFMASYAWWTSRITGTLCQADDPIPLDPTSAAAQVEAYAAARRRDAYRHPQRCMCDACGIRHHGEVQRTQLTHRAA
jgi:hypothetical protein